VEAIEAHPLDSFSLPGVRNTKNGGLQKKASGGPEYLRLFIKKCFKAREAQHTPMIDIIFFCLEWLNVKPSALNLSQALLFRKSGNQKNTNKQTNNQKTSHAQRWQPDSIPGHKSRKKHRTDSATG